MAGRENRRGERLLLEEKRSVVIAPLGSDVRYRLETRNVSLKGLFLEFDKPERFPFTEASLMEIWFDVGADDLIKFIAKMTRLVTSADDEASLWGTGIATKIIQIDKEDEERLDAFLEKELANNKNKITKDEITQAS